MGTTVRWVILSVIMVLLFACPLAAVDFGLKSGFHHSSLDFNDQSLNNTFKGKWEGVVGAFLSIPVTPRVSAVPDVILTFDSRDYAKEIGYDIHRFAYEISYITLTIPLHFHGTSDSRVRLGAYSGPYVGFLREAHVIKAWHHGGLEVFGEREDVARSVNRTDFGIVFGGVIRMGCFFCDLILEARYSLGLAEVVDDPMGFSERIGANGVIRDEGLARIVGENESVKNQKFMVMLGIGF